MALTSADMIHGEQQPVCAATTPSKRGSVPHAPFADSPDARAQAEKIVRILYIEDETVDQQAFQRYVQRERADFDCTFVGSIDQARACLASQQFDVLVCDYRLSDGTAFDLLDQAPDTPFIIVTGLEDQKVAVMAMKRGACDYLVKDNNHEHLEMLPLAVDRALAENAAAQRQHDMRLQLEKSHKDLGAILGQLRLGVVMIDEQGSVRFANPAAEQMLQIDAGTAQDQVWQDICPFNDADKLRLRDMANRPAYQRERIALTLQAADGQAYAMDVEVHEDPRHQARRILFLYDTTTIHDLRQLLHDKAIIHGIVGKSERMQVVYEQIHQLSRVETTVLIEGETGTGKELVARALHAQGPRKDKPFVALNCAGLNESLLASQLFGHKRGAFTGAYQDQPGHFEAADGGTLFLDEIGGISPGLQSSLLRVLQEREVIRAGESAPRRVDVRIIAATHRDLNAEVQRGAFRADLLYRIRVARITLPPLRDRKVDIPPLVQYFLRQFRAGGDKDVQDFSDRAMRQLLDYHWPGNVRELHSAVEFAAIRCRGSVIDVQDLPPELFDHSHPRADDFQNMDNERERILAALSRAKGNRTLASQLLGISRATFYRRLTELRIKIS